MKEKRKIVVLFFLGLYPEKTGGMEVYNYRLAKELLKRDDVILVTQCKSLPTDFPQKKYIVVPKSFCFIRRFGFEFLTALFTCIFSHKTSIFRWNTILIPYTSSFDYNAWPILLLHKIIGVKYVIHCHGGGIKPWHTPRLQKSFFEHSEKAAVVTSTIAEEYSKRCNKSFSILPPLVSFPKFCKEKINEFKQKYDVRDFNKVVLYVGSLKPLKSPETLLKAFKILERKDVILLIAGDGILRGELQQKYSSKNICFLGLVPNDHISELFSIADIYVIPSWFEGTSVSLLEAMSCGLCCIGSNVLGINTMLKDGENGMLFPKNDSKELALCLRRALDDTDLSSRMGIEAKETYCKRYSYEHHINEVLRFINIV